MFLRTALPLLAFLAAPVAQVFAQDLPETGIDAIRAAGQGDLALAFELAPDPVTRDLVAWLKLRAGEGSFDDHVLFGAARPDWPDARRLQEKAEEALEKGRDPALVIDWFGDEAPRTGEGAVRLAEALIARGKPDRATEVVQAAWRDLRLTEEGEAALRAAFLDKLEPVHEARIDALLWRWRTDEAKRMLDLLDDDQRALAEARIGYIRKAGDLEDRVAAVPEALRDHPGLLYDRYNWLADQGRRAEAVEMIRAQSTSAEALGEPFRWSGWRRSLARWEMRNGRPDVAYELASRHFLTEGTSYADLEWIAGYVALTYLDDAAVAFRHFEAARAAVDSPISVSRTEYWRGRALAALNRTEEARAAYEAAAEHQTAFYGLIASDEIGKPLSRDLVGAGAAWDPRLLDNDRIRAALLLMEAGERGAALQFFVMLGHDLPEAEIAALGAALTEPAEVFFAVAMGKAAVTRGKVVPSVYFPLHPLAETEMLVDPALALAIARRESEFNAGVGSPVGALGLMQLMPATAEEVAGFLGEPYSRARLTGDWRYNARLGVRYLAELQAVFGPSPVQIAAGYNAGPSRPAAWMQERGDPRVGEIDVVDWIEHIPFRETRNYAMRVTESLPIYQARLSGNAGPVRFRAILNGEKPVVRPVARGEAPGPGETRLRAPAAAATPAPAPAPETATTTTPQRAIARPVAPAAPAAPAAPSGPRPVARPGG